ncbi:MAG: enoyl-ACP reductase [Alphaproteobacteria bacterium]|nr:enoyl-ACP reductase [Alphaproteobacteria bacterium]
MTKLMEGKKGLVMGVANERSIAWGIAKNLADNGAKLAFTYQGEALEKRVRPLAQSVGSEFLLQCDVTDSASMDKAFDAIKEKFGAIDFIVHAIAFAPKEALHGAFINVSREDFATAMNISCFSFIDVCKRAQSIMNPGGSLVTLTYYGSEKVLPNYNVMGVAKAALEASVRYAACDLGPMGIRVNAVSAGPIKTLAAAGVGDINSMLRWNENNSPLRRIVTQDEVGKSALFLLSDLASAITGEVLYVDAGYNVIGMMATESVDKNLELLQTFPKK